MNINGLKVRVVCGDCLDVLKTIPDNRIHATVSDPPYGLAFMGKEWDHGVPGVLFWEQVFRVLKPGAHLLAFGGTRTHHRLAVAIEDAGFEVRDSLHWIYGTGFPKSLDVGKAIDKAAGAERGVLRVEDRRSEYDGRKRNSKAINTNWRSAEGRTDVIDVSTRVITDPATHEAKQWDGWGTALKPAHEPIILARKPFKGTVVDCVCKHGTGGICIDGCRVATNDNLNGGGYSPGDPAGMWTPGEGGGGLKRKPGEFKQPAGRWPPNVILTHSPDCGAICAEDCPVREIDRQGGHSTTGRRSKRSRESVVSGTQWGTNNHCSKEYPNESGGASRFFPVFKYCPKAPKKERTCNGKVENKHPTVKPIALMRYLVRLITPPNGIVLDPFMGSGSTGIAAIEEGFKFIGIDKDEESYETAKKRMQAWSYGE